MSKTVYFSSEIKPFSKVGYKPLFFIGSWEKWTFSTNEPSRFDARKQTLCARECGMKIPMFDDFMTS